MFSNTVELNWMYTIEMNSKCVRLNMCVEKRIELKRKCVSECRLILFFSLVDINTMAKQNEALNHKQQYGGDCVCVCAFLIILMGIAAISTIVKSTGSFFLENVETIYKF